MATYRRQLIDEDGNVILPDVGIDLDKVVYADTPTGEITLDAWVKTADITDEAKRKYAYLPGDVVEIAYCVLGGCTEGSTNTCRWTLPVNKSLDLVTGVTVALTAGSGSYYTDIGQRQNPGTYTGEIVGGNCIGFTTTMGGTVATYKIGQGRFGTIKLTFS